MIPSHTSNTNIDITVVININSKQLRGHGHHRRCAAPGTSFPSASPVMAEIDRRRRGRRYYQQRLR